MKLIVKKNDFLEIGASSDDIPCIDNCEFTQSRSVVVDVHRRESTKSSGNWNSNNHLQYSPECSPATKSTKSTKSDISSPIGAGEYIRFKYSPTSSMQSSTVVGAIGADWIGGQPAMVCGSGTMSKSMNAADWNDSGILPSPKIFQPSPQNPQTPKRYASLGSRSSDMSSLGALAVPPMCEPPRSPDALAELQVELKAVLSSLESFTQQAKLAKDTSPPPPAPAPYPVQSVKDLKELSLTPDLVQNLPARNGTPTSERSDDSPRPAVAGQVPPGRSEFAQVHPGRNESAQVPPGRTEFAEGSANAFEDHSSARILPRFFHSRPPSQELTAAEKFAQSRDGTLKKAASSVSPNGIAYAVTAIPNATPSAFPNAFPNSIPNTNSNAFPSTTPSAFSNPISNSAASTKSLCEISDQFLDQRSSSSITLSKGEKPPVAPKPRRAGSPVPGRKYRPAKEVVEISKM